MELNNKNKITESTGEMSQEKLLNFFGTAVHDIKAPFRNISSYLDIIKSKISECTSAADFEPYFKRIEGAKNKITILLEELMKFIRTSSADAKPETIQLSKLLEEVTVDQHGVEITVPADLMIKGDSAMIKDLMRSLISNAVKFKSERPFHLNISAFREDHEITISVEDNGMGIDKKYQEKIFEPFERLNSPDEFPGAGLGLSICKMIAEKHGGKISVKSEPGKGSTFSVMLPS